MGERRKLMEDANKIIEQAKSAEVLLEAELGPSKSRALVRQLQAQLSSLQIHTNSLGREAADSVATTIDEHENEVESLAECQIKSKEACVTNELTEPVVIAAGA